MKKKKRNKGQREFLLYHLWEFPFVATVEKNIIIVVIVCVADPRASL